MKFLVFRAIIESFLAHFCCSPKEDEPKAGSPPLSRFGRGALRASNLPKFQKLALLKQSKIFNGSFFGAWLRDNGL